MSFTLEFDDGQLAIHHALEQLCEAHASDAVGRVPWSRGLWNELAESGVFAPCTEAGEGGALEIAAALEALGEGACPGPFIATYFATQALSADPEAVAQVVDASWLVSLGADGLFPLGDEADLWIDSSGYDARRGRPRGPIQGLECLGGDPSARLDFEADASLVNLERAHVLADVARAAQLSGCARRLVALASEHARTRKQFRKPSGDFQAVAHPLADAHMHVEAASSLGRVAAFAFDHDDEVPVKSAALARLSASAAALETIHVVHQVFGAVGITLEGPIYHMTRRLRQWVSDPPSAAASCDAVLSELGWSASDAAGD